MLIVLLAAGCTMNQEHSISTDATECLNELSQELICSFNHGQHGSGYAVRDKSSAQIRWTYTYSEMSSQYIVELLDNGTSALLFTECVVYSSTENAATEKLAEELTDFIIEDKQHCVTVLIFEEDTWHPTCSTVYSNKSHTWHKEYMFIDPPIIT